MGREGLLLLLALADLMALLVRVARLDRVGLELPELRVARAVQEDPVERRARRAVALEPRRRWWRLAGRPAG